MVLSICDRNIIFVCLTVLRWLFNGRWIIADLSSVTLGLVLGLIFSRSYELVPFQTTPIFFLRKSLICLALRQIIRAFSLNWLVNIAFF